MSESLDTLKGSPAKMQMCSELNILEEAQWKYLCQAFAITPLF